MGREVKTCRIHDLLRDLSISEAREDKFLDVQWSLNSPSPTRARRITIHGNIDSFIHLNRSTSHRRSLLCFTQRPNFELLQKNDWRFLCTGFQLLRVLDLPQLDIHKLPNEIGEMIHLRYLGLGEGPIMRLTSTLDNLNCLQTLNMQHNITSTLRNLNCLQTLNIQHNDTRIQHLPNVINEMHQLRHLVTNYGILNDRSRVDGLRNLQTLSKIEAGRWIGNGLAKLMSLRRLGIMNALDSHKEALSESIVKLNSLQSLMLEVCYSEVVLPTLMLASHVHLYKLKLSGCIEKLPDVHEFPPNLIRLTLWNSYMTTDPMATLEKLPFLRILEISILAYIGKEMICSAGGFPQLEELKLGTIDIIEWKVEEGAMLNLRRLHIHSCDKLKMLPDGLQHVTTLQKLKLSSISNELNSWIRSLKDGPDWYKFQHVTSLSIIQ